MLCCSSVNARRLHSDQLRFRFVSLLLIIKSTIYLRKKKQLAVVGDSFMSLSLVVALSIVSVRCLFVFCCTHLDAMVSIIHVQTRVALHRFLFSGSTKVMLVRLSCFHHHPRPLMIRNKRERARGKRDITDQRKVYDAIFSIDSRVGTIDEQNYLR